MAFAGKNAGANGSIPAPTPANIRAALGPNARLAAHADGALTYVSPADFLAEQAASEPDLLPATDLDLADATQTVIYAPDGTALVSTLAQQRAYFAAQLSADPDLPAAATADLADAAQQVIYRADGTALVATLVQVKAFHTAGLAAAATSIEPLPDLDGLAAHYDPGRAGATFTAADFATPATVGGRVGMLDFASGVGELLKEDTASVRPTLVESNGRRAIRFTAGIFTRLTSPLGPDWTAVNAQDVTWAVAVRMPATLASGQNNIAAIYRDSATASGKIVLVLTDGSTRQVAFGRFGSTGGGVIGRGSATPAGGLLVIVARSSFSGRVLDLNVNGVDAAQVTLTADFGVGADFDLLQLGAERYSTANASCDLLEAVFYRTYKTPFGVARLRSYLTRKHGG